MKNVILINVTNIKIMAIAHIEKHKIHLKGKDVETFVKDKFL